MDNIVVITQNVKLESLHLLRDSLKGRETLIFSTQLVFDNEKTIIERELDSKCVFKNFSDFLSDSDFQHCDEDAYLSTKEPLDAYYNRIKEIKNDRLIKKLLDIYVCDNRIIVCDDLGLDIEVWLKHGFIKHRCDYYYEEEAIIVKKTSPVQKLFNLIKKVYSIPKYVGVWKGNTYIFYGSLNRIAYRLDLKLVKASFMQSIIDVFIVLMGRLTKKAPKSKKIRMSTLHERGNGCFLDSSNMNLKLIQDGYLPPNYSSKYLLFGGQNVEYYTWDAEGNKTFEFHQLPHRIIPFRKKLYLPTPRFPEKIKKILCVASGAGDWTALKSRSDEDKMMEVFGRVAAMYPDIEFIYRCHPVWIHPQHQGVNSINRAAEYFNWLNLPNLKISSNIPNAEENGKFRLSYKRSSLEEDLKDVDIVFGEHSISMIDAAFKNILFCSVNMSGRRDLFAGISKMGFPHCESVEEIVSVLNNAFTDDFKDSYMRAIANYNEMTDLK